MRSAVIQTSHAPGRSWPRGRTRRSKPSRPHGSAALPSASDAIVRPARRQWAYRRVPSGSPVICQRCVVPAGTGVLLDTCTPRSTVRNGAVASGSPARFSGERALIVRTTGTVPAAAGTSRISRKAPRASAVAMREPSSGAPGGPGIAGTPTVTRVPGSKPRPATAKRSPEYAQLVVAAIVGAAAAGAAALARMPAKRHQAPEATRKARSTRAIICWGLRSGRERARRGR